MADADNIANELYVNDDKLHLLIMYVYVTSTPCQFAAHPYTLGSLAGATSKGEVFWGLHRDKTACFVHANLTSEQASYVVF